jgi:hypothetical protein
MHSFTSECTYFVSANGHVALPPMPALIVGAIVSLAQSYRWRNRIVGATVSLAQSYRWRNRVETQPNRKYDDLRKALADNVYTCSYTCS